MTLPSQDIGAPRRSPFLVTYLLWAIALILALTALASVALPVASIGFVYERSYNEGWNAYHAARAAAGEALYGGRWHPVNYPFLSFYLIGWLTPLFGDPLIIGRAVNVLSLGAVVGCSALIVRRLGGGALGMLLAAAGVLAFQEIQASHWIAADEPQMLAEGLMLGGLLVYLSGPIGWGRLATCALLFAAGGFVKHIIVAVPVAVTVDLALRDRRWFAAWCLCLVVAFGLLLGFNDAFAGGGVVGDVLAPRLYHWKSVVYQAKKFLIHLKTPLIGSLVLLALPLPPRWAVLLRAYGAAALLAGLFFSGGDGVSTNAYLELCVAMGIIGGVAAGQCRSARERRPVVRGLALLAMIAVAMPLITRVPREIVALRDAATAWRAYRQQEVAFGAAVTRLRALPGLALCESLLLCFEAGKALTVDTFSARNEILTGQAGEDALIADIADHRFAVIVMPDAIMVDFASPGHVHAGVLTEARFTAATLAAINRHYAVADQVSGATFYLPKSGDCGIRCS